MTVILQEKSVAIFTPEGMESDPRALDQLANCLLHPQARAGALMADHHLGYAMPIGGVVEYEDAISPTGVGFDIACGNMAVKTDLTMQDLTGVSLRDEDTPENNEAVRAGIKPIMREIQKKVEFGVGRKNATPIENALFDSPVWSEIDAQFGTDLKVKAREQLGTVGSGNHYVDLLVDANGFIWIANHFGSRGLGHTLASGFMAAAAGEKFTSRVKEGEEPVVFSTKEELGTFYVAAMQLAGDYAYAGREYVINTVLGILGAAPVAEVHNHHNYAWYENGVWVVRKGATPLTRDPAFIGGSMGDFSAIVRGSAALDPLYSIGNKTAVKDIGALASAPHGAGRVMSRTAAAGKFRKMWSCSNRDCRFAVRSEGNKPNSVDVCPGCGGNRFKKIRMRDESTAAINWSDARADLTARGITVLGAGADESPGVYKPLRDVLAAHSNIEILELLRPLGVVMASPDTLDPYKD